MVVGSPEELFDELERTAIHFETDEDFKIFLRTIQTEYQERWFPGAKSWKFDRGRWPYININPYNGKIALSHRGTNNWASIYSWEEVRP